MFTDGIVANEGSSIEEPKVIRAEYIELINKVASELDKLDLAMNEPSSFDSHEISDSNQKQFLKKVSKFIEEQKLCGEEKIIAAVVDSFSKASRDLEIKLNLASTTSSLTEDNKTQYLNNIKESVLNLIKGSLFSSEQSLLLARDIIGSVPNKYNLDIIELAISKCYDVNPRNGEGVDNGLINIMVSQRVMSSDPDLSNMFDLMVSKGLQMPDEDVIKKFVTDSRIRSGNNAKKLAQSFLNIGDDSSFIDTIIGSQNKLENTVKDPCNSPLISQHFFNFSLQKHTN
jgi:hypothetical protein